MATSQYHPRPSAVAAALLALSLGLAAHDASALALGRLSVQSGLGEPLRAEIDIPEITAAEAETLRTSMENVISAI